MADLDCDGMNFVCLIDSAALFISMKSWLV